ncbi:hypothetical protein ACL1IJ_12005, partial [Corynebacterium striatum]
TRTNNANRRADSVGPAPVPTTRNPAVPGLRNTGTQNPHLTVEATLFGIVGEAGDFIDVDHLIIFSVQH